MVLAPIRLDDFRLPESERRQTVSATEGYVGASGIDFHRDTEMAWKQLRRRKRHHTGEAKQLPSCDPKQQNIVN